MPREAPVTTAILPANLPKVIPLRSVTEVSTGIRCVRKTVNPDSLRSQSWTLQLQRQSAPS
jgi:hypothetical protein